MKRKLLVFSCAALFALMSSFVMGCGKDKGGTGGGGSEGGSGELAALCTKAEAAFKKADPKDAKTFKLSMSNVITACGGACEKGDKASCGILDGFMKTLCKVSGSVCTSLCKVLKTKATKDAACKYAP